MTPHRYTAGQVGGAHLGLASDEEEPSVVALGVDSIAMLDRAEVVRPRRASKVDSIRPTYGFDDVSLAPGVETVEPADVDVSADFCGVHLRAPILGSAMDAVADVRLSGELARLGGVAVINLEGVQM